MTNNPDALKQNKSAQPTLEQARLMLEEAEKTHAVDRQKARAVAEEGLASCRMLDDAKLLAQALDLVGQIYQPLGLLVNAKALMEEALTLRQTLDDTEGIAQSLRNLSNIARWMGRFEEAEELIRQSIALFIDLDDQHQLAQAVHTLHGILVYGGKFAQGIRLMDEPGQIYRGLQLPAVPSKPTIVSAFALMHLGRYDEAQQRFQMTLSHYPKTAIGYAVKNLGRIAMARGNYDEAQTHLLEALTLFRNTEDMNGLGQTVGCLGILALRLGNRLQAQKYIYENLQIATDTLIILPSMTALSSLALLRIEEGDREGAIEFYTVASQNGHVANSQWYHDVIGQYIDVAAQLSPSSESVRGPKHEGESVLGVLCYRIFD